MPDYVTSIQIRQKNVSHDVAFQQAIDAANSIAGQWPQMGVRLEPTLPDEPLSTPEESEEFMEGDE